MWCRTTTVPYFDDDFDSVGERAARGSDGKTYFVPADMKYRDWEKAFVDGDKITDNINVNRTLYAKAKEMLNHRSGTKYEDIKRNHDIDFWEVTP